jgi:hypothetical protein
MDPTIFDQIEKATESASPATIRFIMDLKKNPILGKAFQQFNISEDDQSVFVNEITYTALGIRQKDELGVYIAGQTAGNEEHVDKAFDSLGELIASIPPISVAVLASKPLTTPKQIDDLAGVSSAEILSAIENPTPSVTQPDFAVPKTKPLTSDILRNIPPSASASSRPGAAGSITIPPGFSATASLDQSTNTDTIVDPFKGVSPDAPEQPPTVFASQTAMSTQMESKLSDMTGSAPRETFKIMPLSETMKGLSSDTETKPRPSDPYREPIA